MQMLPCFRDPSTGLPVRRSFVLAMKLAVAQAQRSGRRLAVQALHVGLPTAEPAGEATVAKVGRLLQLANGNRGDLARLDDLLFAVLLQDSDILAARAHAESLRDAVAVYYAKQATPVRLSIGVACSPAHPHWNGRDLLDLAMWRCVQAVHSGRAAIGSGDVACPGA